MPGIEVCGAETGTAERKRRCQNRAGKGTVHPGKGRCYKHGGIVAEEPRWLARATRMVPMRRGGAPMTMTEDEARGYTGSPSLAVLDEPEPVSLDEQRAITIGARRLRLKERDADVNKRVEDALAMARTVSETFREVAKAAALKGHDISEMAAKVKNLVDAEKRKL